MYECRTGKRSLTRTANVENEFSTESEKNETQQCARRTSSLLSHRRTHLQIYSMIYMKDVTHIGIAVNVERKDFK